MKSFHYYTDEYSSTITLLLFQIIVLKDNELKYSLAFVSFNDIHFIIVLKCQMHVRQGRFTYFYIPEKYPRVHQLLLLGGRGNSEAC